MSKPAFFILFLCFTLLAPGFSQADEPAAEEKQDVEAIFGEKSEVYASRSLPELRGLAEDGNDVAQYELAVHYLNNCQTTDDYMNAILWLQSAAREGHTPAMRLLGAMKLWECTDESREEGFRWFNQAIDEGDTHAMLFLARLYREGKDVPQDDAQAFALTERAADAGHAEAAWVLARYYREGYACEPSEAKYEEYFRKAAENGLSFAQVYLALKADKNEDYTEAAKWFLKQAEQDNPSAQFAIGRYYNEGLGVEKDPEMAMYWWKKSAENGDSRAQANLGLLYKEKDDPATAVVWYQKAAEQGNAIAQMRLFYIYYRGDGVPQDNEEAIKWLTKAAEQDRSDAQVVLGCIYHEGWCGLEKDVEKSLTWFRKAAALGDANAIKIVEAHEAAKDGEEQQPGT